MSQVLALKYRPKRFEDLIGQESISQTLSLSLGSSRLSHAYLFSGLRGSGKTSTARIFAKSLVCNQGPTSTPCEVCENCQMANEGRHIDIIEMDAASTRKIDDIRDVIEQSKYHPSIGKFKIFIIDEVHMLTKEAFNALLKTLEEPPSYVKFILATTDPLKLPATILSRTQHFRFKKIPQNDVIHHLTHILNLEQIEFEKEAIEIIARTGGGSLRDTLTILDQAIIYSKNIVDVSTVTSMLGLVDPSFIDQIFKSILQDNENELIEFVQSLQEYEAEMVIDEFINSLTNKLYNNDPMLNTLLYDRFFNILSDSKRLLSLNSNGSFVLLLTFRKMVEARKLKSIEDMIYSLESKVDTSTPVQPIQTPKKEVVEEIQKEEVIEEPKVEKVEEINYSGLFEQLTKKVYDRNFELGECFEKNIEFVSYENDTLTWSSKADENCKKALRNGYSIIKTFVQEIFGIETNIAMVPAKIEEVIQDMQEHANEDSSSMMEQQIVNEEYVEGGGSCVTGNCNEQKPAEELSAKELLETEMIQKTSELFKAKKITVHPKV